MSGHDRGYKCPACGEAATSVVQTSTLSRCVIRNRKCLYCGYAHETCEFPMEVGEAILEAANVLTENSAAKLGLNAQ